MTTAFSLVVTFSPLVRLWSKGREARRWRSGKHWRDAPAGPAGKAGDGSPKATSPAGSNDSPADAAIQTGGGTAHQDGAR